jgi:hypothetical protein
VSGQLVGLLSLHEGEVQQGFHPTSRKIQDLEKAMIKSTGVLKGGQFCPPFVIFAVGRRGKMAVYIWQAVILQEGDGPE